MNDILKSGRIDLVAPTRPIDTGIHRELGSMKDLQVFPYPGSGPWSSQGHRWNWTSRLITLNLGTRTPSRWLYNFRSRRNDISVSPGRLVIKWKSRQLLLSKCVRLTDHLAVLILIQWLRCLPLIRGYQVGKVLPCSCWISCKLTTFC